MDIKEQNIIQAFAKVYVNNEKELISLLKKYGYVAKANDDELDILLFISGLQGNEKFDKELTSLFLKKGDLKLSPYKNVLAELIAGAINALATMTGKIVGQKGVREAGVLQTQSETQQALLAYMAQERELKAKRERTNLIIFAGVWLILTVTIAIIVLKPKK